MRNLFDKLVECLGDNIAQAQNNNTIYEARVSDIRKAFATLTVDELMSIIQKHDIKLYWGVMEAVEKALDDAATKKAIVDASKKAEAKPRKTPAVKITSTYGASCGSSSSSSSCGSSSSNSRSYSSGCGSSSWSRSSC